MITRSGRMFRCRKHFLNQKVSDGPSMRAWKRKVGCPQTEEEHQAAVMRHDFLQDGDHNPANQNRNKKMAGVLKPVVRVGGRLLASHIPMLQHSGVSDGACTAPGTNVSVAGVRANAPGLVDAFCVCLDASCLSCSLLRGKSREQGISVHHGDDDCGFRSL
jgi:hypothetical protein